MPSCCIDLSLAPSLSRRNCSGNPRCLSGLGERAWIQDVKDSAWHDIEDPNSERRTEVIEGRQRAIILLRACFHRATHATIAVAGQLCRLEELGSDVLPEQFSAGTLSFVPRCRRDQALEIVLLGHHPLSDVHFAMFSALECF